MTLYEITNKIGSFVPEIDEETGELLNAAELDALQMERETKLESVALYCKNLAAERDAIKNELDNMKKRLESKEREVNSMKQYLAFALNGERFESPKVKVSYRKTEVVDVKADFVEWAKKNAPQYVRTKVEEAPDKNEIKQALKNGQEIPFVELVENKNLVLK